MKIKVGSRESLLAVAQSNIVTEKIKATNPGIEIELITMKTTGDILIDKSLDEIGGKGVFVKELDNALLRGEVDITVHSFKDLPVDVPDDLPIVCVIERGDPRDALILPKYTDKLDFSKPIGCSSKRRSIQLKGIFRECTIEPIRGNLITRLEKLDRGDYSALVLAYAGLTRIGLEDRVSRIFEPHEILPAACQGAIAVQAKKDFDKSVLESISDYNALISTNAERSFIRRLGGGCKSPVAAYAFVDGNELRLTGLFVSEDMSICMSDTKTVRLRGNIREDAYISEKSGKDLAEYLIAKAGR